MIAHIDNCTLVDGTENITKGWLSKKFDEFIMGKAVANTGAVKNVSGPRKPKTPSFFESYNTFAESRELSIGQRRHFNVIGRVLQRYELHRQILQPKFKLTLDGMDDALLHDLEELHQERVSIAPDAPSDHSGSSRESQPCRTRPEYG